MTELEQIREELVTTLRRLDRLLLSQKVDGEDPTVTPSDSPTDEEEKVHKFILCEYDFDGRPFVFYLIPRGCPASKSNKECFEQFISWMEEEHPDHAILRATKEQFPKLTLIEESDNRKELNKKRHKLTKEVPSHVTCLNVLKPKKENQK